MANAESNEVVVSITLDATYDVVGEHDFHVVGEKVAVNHIDIVGSACQLRICCGGEA